MLLPIMLLLQDKTDVSAAFAQYRARTRAVVECRQPKDADEILVCARRESYRYQTPLVGATRASNAHAQDDLVWTPEAQGHVACGKGAFLVGCGKVGAGVTVSSGGKLGYKLRDTPP